MFELVRSFFPSWKVQLWYLLRAVTQQTNKSTHCYQYIEASRRELTTNRFDWCRQNHDEKRHEKTERHESHD